MDAGSLLLMTVSLVLGGISGFVMHRSDFCMAGALRDWFLFRNTHLVRALLLLIAGSMLLVTGARSLGLLSFDPYRFFAPPGLSNLIGGFFFGIGMVLAGGCVVGTLYKLGAGSRVAAVALGGLLLGSGLYAEIHPWWGGFARATRFPTASRSLGGLIGVSDSALALGLLVLAGAVFIHWASRGRWRQPAFADGYLQPWRAAVLLAIVGLVSCLTVGMPLGVTTSYSKVAAGLESIVWPQHAASLAFFQLNPLDYTAPLGKVRLTGGPGPAFDGIAVIQYPLILGIIGGAAISAWLLGEWQLAGKLPLRQGVYVGLGGILMGLASRMTPGCNIWHLWGGVPIMALQSLLFVAGLLPGTWIGCLLLRRLTFRSEGGIKPAVPEGDSQ